MFLSNLFLFSYCCFLILLFFFYRSFCVPIRYLHLRVLTCILFTLPLSLHCLYYLPCYTILSSHLQTLSRNPSFNISTVLDSLHVIIFGNPIIVFSFFWLSFFMLMCFLHIKCFPLDCCVSHPLIYFCRDLL